MTRAINMRIVTYKERADQGGGPDRLERRYKHERSYPKRATPSSPIQ